MEVKNSFDSIEIQDAIYVREPKFARSLICLVRIRMSGRFPDQRRVKQIFINAEEQQACLTAIKVIGYA